MYSTERGCVSLKFPDHVEIPAGMPRYNANGEWQAMDNFFMPIHPESVAEIIVPVYKTTRNDRASSTGIFCYLAFSDLYRVIC